MSISGLGIAVILLVIVLAYVVYPLLRRDVSDTGTFRSRQRERALAYYERVLRNIRDLDDDLASDKIAQDEYSVERERWMSRGVALLKMLDELDQSHDIVDNVDADDAMIDVAIEDAVRDAESKQMSESV